MPRIMFYVMLVCSVLVAAVLGSTYDFDYSTDQTSPSPLNSKSYFTAVGSDTLVGNRNYNVAVSYFGVQRTATFRVGVRTYTGDDYFKDVVAVQWYTKMVSIPIPAINSGKQYEFYITSTDGSGINQQKPLLLSTKQSSTHFQTDKATYKPGDMVKFRFVRLDRSLRASTTANTLQVYITDNQGNRIKQWSNVTLTLGLYTNELQLSSNPPLGTWRITVEESNGEKQSTTFVVEEYVLPKYAIILTTKSKVWINEGEITVTIEAKYPYGQNVKGKYTITAYVSYNAESRYAIGTTVVRADKPLNGKATETYRLAYDLSIYGNRGVIVNVVFEEELTGKLERAETAIGVFNKRYTVEIFGDSKYKPELSYYAYAVVKDIDGNPVRDTVNRVTIKLTGYSYFWYYNPTTINTQEAAVNSNGIARIHFSDMPTGYSYLTLTASFNGISSSAIYLSTKQNNLNEYIQVSSLTDKPTIGNPVSILVESTETLKYLTYHIRAGNNIVAGKTIKLTPPAMNYTFEFTPTLIMAPVASVVVFYVTEQTGIINAANVDVSLTATFQNSLTLSLSENETEPGKNISITMQTAPNSLVALLGLDQKSLLLRSGNDFDRTKILQSISSFENPNKWELWSDHVEFLDARCVILTDTNIDYIDYTSTAYTDYTSDYTHMETANEMSTAQDVFTTAPGTAEEQTTTSTIRLSTTRQAPQPSVIIRKAFPETWIYENIQIGRFTNGQATIVRTVPDEITKWIITGVSVDPVTGFGMTNQASELNCFFKFFIQTQLPYSLIRGETFALSLIIFNYQDFNVTATVTLDNSLGEFEFAESEGSANSAFITKTIDIAANDGTSLSFLIKPKKIGYSTIKVIAVTGNAGDGVEQQLLVEPEGVEITVCNGDLIDLSNSNTFSKTYSINIPVNAVPDSSRITLSASAQILGPIIKNLDSLVQMPYGCGEQLLITLVPNIVIVEYLTATNQLTDAIKTKSYFYMEQGYQKELAYKHPDGSYSAFGPSSWSPGSTWLTAFVAKSFRSSSKYITIDNNVVNQALAFLKARQLADGSFEENGVVIHTDMQGGGTSSVARSVYVTLTFLQTPEDRVTYKPQIDKALAFALLAIQNGNDDVYTLALTAYALQLYQHEKRTEILNKLKLKAKTENEKTWWEKQISGDPSLNYYYSYPNSYNVELTGYCLLTYVEAGLFIEGLNIMRWLIAQQNSYGGFSSTQDTVIGITALAKMAAKLASAAPNFSIVSSYNSQSTIFTFTQANERVVQQAEIPSNVTSVNIMATGTGSGIYQVCSSYYDKEIESYPRFTCQPTVLSQYSVDSLVLEVCGKYILNPDANENNSSMAVMEISLPSGFVADTEWLLTLIGPTNRIMKTATENFDSKIILYFDYFDSTTICITVKATQSVIVLDQKPVAVRLYNYYDTTQQCRDFYTPVSSTMCDICDGSSCNGLNCTPRSSTSDESTIQETTT